MSQALVALIQEHFPNAVIEAHAQYGDETVVLEAAQWKAVHQFLFKEPRAQMNMLVDLTAVDFPDREPRFEVVTHLLSLDKGHRIRLKSRVGDQDGDDAEIDTLTEIWASANWMERECWDLLGVRFKGHPDLRRILLYAEFVGHPLRRDYPADKIQPLVEYRDIPNIGKLPPFDTDEGMPFGRQTHAGVPDPDADEDAQVNRWNR